MDPRHAKAKRPRSLTPSSKGGAEARKKRKKNKKSKNDAPATETTQEKHRHHHHKDTATADGHIMAQMLTTFSSLEQSRFQAYKRATFAADTVEQWVAACLQDRYQDTSTTYPRPLEDLVAPGQAQDIGLVVAIAAKIYAQRLVAEAVALQEKQAAVAKLPTSSGSGGTPAAAAAVVAPLPPTAIWKAVLERRKRGVDPGFFLQPATEASSESLNWAVTAASSSAISHDVRRLAAEHAQEEYDKHVRAAQPKDDNNDGDGDDASKKKPSENSPDQAETKSGDDGDAMEVEETKSPGDTAEPPSAAES